MFVKSVVVVDEIGPLPVSENTHPLEESVMARSERRVSHVDYQSAPKFQKVYYVNVGTMPIETMQLTYRG